MNGFFLLPDLRLKAEISIGLPMLLTLACLCFSIAARAQTSTTAASPVLRAVVSETNPVPYAMFSAEGKLMGGISKSLIDKIGQLNQLPVLYLDVPRARVEGWLISNQADIGCFLSPDWVSRPKDLAWVGPLFYSSQLVVRRSNSKPILRLSDMYHKRIGTIRGFVYPELEQAFAERLMIRDDAHSLESNLTRLAQGRLDAVMAVDLSLGYVMSKRQFEIALSFDPLWTQPPAIFCAISLDSPLRPALLQSFEQLQQSGYIQQLLQQYQPTMAATTETSSVN
ncbi:substrate-binding periplasmic protein [Rheinheimera sp. SA_1]|uniref:substrate-binding periplasmic protein n=1 Tax=Rheinheimera sp. SA_1 TaxID=1827365 RepID=UPI0018D28633|nr:transporter substrate-binding domain-containing protein [Rheinheimera sp. SA_1]